MKNYKVNEYLNEDFELSIKRCKKLAGNSTAIHTHELAEMVYMAPSYLSCVFKKETGQNLSKFIKSVRMEKAKEMLDNTHMKIVNISAEVGYPNVSYFCQSFREYYGISPQKFRSGAESIE